MSLFVWLCVVDSILNICTPVHPVFNSHFLPLCPSCMCLSSPLSLCRACPVGPAKKPGIEKLWSIIHTDHWPGRRYTVSLRWLPEHSLVISYSVCDCVHLSAQICVCLWTSVQGRRKECVYACVDLLGFVWRLMTELSRTYHTYKVQYCHCTYFLHITKGAAICPEERVNICFFLSQSGGDVMFMRSEKCNLVGVIDRASRVNKLVSVCRVYASVLVSGLVCFFSSS